MKGKIIFYHQVKGYGFIKTDSGEELFFHVSELADYKPPQVNINQEVEFLVQKLDKGDKAIQIKKIGKEVQSGRKKETSIKK